jgi:mannose-6-phosphate isomerase-like protein (cupin superfamily)
MDVASRADSFCPEPVGYVEELTAQVMVGNGVSPEFVNTLSDSLWLVLQGEAQMQAEGEAVDMAEGDLVIIGRDVPHCWSNSGDTVMFLLSRWAEVKC